MNKYLDGARVCESPPREGELYRRVTVFGRVFELRYGYYDDKDRTGAPDIIYPDFLKEPIYKSSGEPFVTMMQDACEHYEGGSRTEDTLCSECKHFERAEEWFGICNCPKNLKRTE